MNEQRMPGKFGGLLATTSGCRLWTPAIAKSTPAPQASSSKEGASAGPESSLAPAAGRRQGRQGADHEPELADSVASGAAG